MATPHRSRFLRSFVHGSSASRPPYAVVRTSSVSRLPVSQQSGRLEILINLQVLLIKFSFSVRDCFIDYCTRASWHFTESEPWLSSKFLQLPQISNLNLITKQNNSIEFNLITGIAGLHGTLTENPITGFEKNM